MKRSLLDITEQVKLFTLDELSQNTRLVSEYFFSSGGGGDVFRKEILGLLSRQMDVVRLLKMRLVCKKWSDYILTVRHFSIEKRGILDKLPFGTFRQITSLGLHPLILASNRHLAYSNITELSISSFSPYKTIDNSISLLGWISLKNLSIDFSIRFMMKGLSQLTTLTSLSCDVKCFSSPQDIYNLTNLTSLEIPNFPPRLDLITKLPCLSYLASSSPTHFVSFTGEGRLNTDPLTKDESQYISRKDFNFYYDGAIAIDCTGKWESGLFTGKAFFRVFEPLNKRNLCVGGYMKNGIFEGNVREEDFQRRTGSYGKWEAGKKHGIHQRYEWEESQYPNYRTVMLEDWFDNFLQSSEICVETHKNTGFSYYSSIS